VAAGGTDALVLVVDVGGRIERALQPHGADQRGWPPEFVDLAHLFGHGDVPLLGNLLEDQFHREERGERLRADRLMGAGMERRRQRRWQVGGDVVPLLGKVAFAQQDLGFHAAPPRLVPRRVRCGGRTRVMNPLLRSDLRATPVVMGNKIPLSPHRRGEGFSRCHPSSTNGNAEVISNQARPEPVGVMPWALVTAPAPSEPTGLTTQAFGPRLPGPFGSLRWRRLSPYPALWRPRWRRTRPDHSHLLCGCTGTVARYTERCQVLGPRLRP
jgi:hypothetical protein